MQAQQGTGYRYYELRQPQQWGTLEGSIRRDEETAIVKLPPGGLTQGVEYSVYIRGRYARTHRTLAEAEATVRRAAVLLAGQLLAGAGPR